MSFERSPRYRRYVAVLVVLYLLLWLALALQPLDSITACSATSSANGRRA